MRSTNTIAMVGALAASATVGLLAATPSASAAPPARTPGVELSVFKDPNIGDHYWVTVKGVIPMDAYDAHGYINNLHTGARPGGIMYTLYGDDGKPQFLNQQWFPGHGESATGYLRAESDGIHYSRQLYLTKGVVDEDADGLDELYAESYFVDGDGGVRKAYTNVVTGWF